MNFIWRCYVPEKFAICVCTDVLKYNVTVKSLPSNWLRIVRKHARLDSLFQDEMPVDIPGTIHIVEIPKDAQDIMKDAVIHVSRHRYIAILEEGGERKLPTSGPVENGEASDNFYFVWNRHKERISSASTGSCDRWQKPEAKSVAQRQASSSGSTEFCCLWPTFLYPHPKSWTVSESNLGHSFCHHRYCTFIMLLLVEF